MLFIRMIFIVMSYLMVGSTHAQNLLPAPISTAPYYFNAQPYMYPQMSQPYSLPNYWQQQQQPNFMNFMPALNQISSMIEDDLGPSRNGELAQDDDDRDSGRKSYKTDSKFTFNPNYKPKGSSPSARTTPTPTPATTDDDCESCRQNQTSQPTVLTTEATRTITSTEDVATRVLDESLQAYQDSSQVKKMIDYIKNQSTKLRNQRRQVVGSKARSTSVGRCLMYVKFGLVDAGFFRSYPSGTYASNFSPALENQGFTNLMKSDGYNIQDPKDAPVGSVIVYENDDGGGKTPGHIEVKLGPNEYGSDYIDDQPRNATSSTRKIIGIYAKLPAGGA